MVATISLQSAFTSSQDIPPTWVEVLIFSKDPSTIEFFEQPRFRLVNSRRHVVEVRASAFPALRMWLLYRIDESVSEQAGSMDADRRRLYETHKDAAWVFALPVAPDLTEISIDGANLTYTAGGGRRSVTGAAFNAPLARYGFRKGPAGYVRIDHLPQVDFGGASAETNRVLPDDLHVDPTNRRTWPGDAALHVMPKTLGGRPYFGPGERDRAAIERGYTPAFIVLANPAQDALLRRERAWAAVERTAGQLLTDPSRQDPELWSRLPADAQDRYRPPARIRAGTETRLIVLWQRDADATSRVFVLFLRDPGGDDFRALIFRLLAASAR
ncbi:MAG: hypothetical protein QN178_09235 [Armatimonadota bacterium]|nr:hypothetical protein [Armatimonadota bacterium]